MDELPPYLNTRDFYRSRPFHFGLIIVDGLTQATSQIQILRAFYTPGLFCGNLNHLQAVKNDSRKDPYSICLRAHFLDDVCAWWRDGDEHMAGQSMRGWKMARDYLSCLQDRDEGRTIAARGIYPTPPEWSDFQW